MRDLVFVGFLAAFFDTCLARKRREAAWRLVRKERPPALEPALPGSGS